MERDMQGFETERLWLMPSGPEDAAFFLEILNSDKWLQHVGDRNVHTLEEAAQYIRTRIMPQYERLGYGNYTLVRKEDDEKIGLCGLYDREGLEGVDIGFALLPAYEREGYAYEAANVLKHAAFEKFGLSKISAITIHTNTASQKLLEKLGLKYIRDIVLEGDDEVLMLYEREAE